MKVAIVIFIILMMLYPSKVHHEGQPYVVPQDCSGQMYWIYKPPGKDLNDYIRELLEYLRSSPLLVINKKASNESST